jgi:hypothetical protein
VASCSICCSASGGCVQLIASAIARRTALLSSSSQAQPSNKAVSVGRAVAAVVQRKRGCLSRCLMRFCEQLDVPPPLIQAQHLLVRPLLRRQGGHHEHPAGKTTACRAATARVSCWQSASCAALPPRVAAGSSASRRSVSRCGFPAWLIQTGRLTTLPAGAWRPYAPLHQLNRLALFIFQRQMVGGEAHPQVGLRLLHKGNARTQTIGPIGDAPVRRLVSQTSPDVRPPAGPSLSVGSADPKVGSKAVCTRQTIPSGPGHLKCVPSINKIRRQPARTTHGETWLEAASTSCKSHVSHGPAWRNRLRQSLAETSASPTNTLQMLKC